MKFRTIITFPIPLLKGLLPLLLLICASPLKAQNGASGDSVTTSWDSFTPVSDGFTPSFTDAYTDLPFMFSFGNGIIITYDETVAKRIGSALGLAFPARGVNKVGAFYSSLNFFSNATATASMPTLGYLGSNDKIYRSAEHYHSAPDDPLVDPGSFGRYPPEKGGAPLVCRL